MTELSIRASTPEDHARLDEIREAAFQPVFASFRSLLGDEIYELAQEPEDQGQAAILTSLLQPDSIWEVYCAELSGRIVGFVSVRVDDDSSVGEIGLNAVHPDSAGAGIGTAMYEFALARMKAAGMKVATVATGGDGSHQPARRAYQKAGFDCEVPSVWMCAKL